MRLLPVTDDVLDYCYEIQKEAKAIGIRVEVDNDGERLAKQIRRAEQERIPIMAVVGAKEKEGKQLSLRARKVGDLGTMSVESSLNAIKAAIDQAVEIQAVIQPVSAASPSES